MVCNCLARIIAALGWGIMLKSSLALLLAFLPLVSQAAIAVQDDTGHTVVLPRPAQRVISMAPHVTELLFAAGVGKRIVGAMNFSDYPPAARQLPLIGSNAQIDIERVIAARSDWNWRASAGPKATLKP
jgi:iron complex transport system substrate-binding protein